MTAVDPTTQADDVERRLQSWMAEQRDGADLAPTYAAIVSATASRPRRRLLVRGAAHTRPPSAWAYRAGRLAPLVILALILTLVIGGGALVGSRLSRPDASPRPDASVTRIIGVPAVVFERDRLPGTPDTRYTSALFVPKVTFGLSPRTPGETGIDICPPVTSPRTIVLSHPRGCVEDLRFIRPWAVACGASGEHPDADALARAILAIPGTAGAAAPVDVQTSEDLPAGLFGEPYVGYVVRIDGGAGPGVVPGATDPDHCALLAEPGTHDPVVEIRHDIPTRFVLLDVGDELVVIRASPLGHDGPSHEQAFAGGGAPSDATALLHLLGLVNDIRFGP